MKRLLFALTFVPLVGLAGSAVPAEPAAGGVAAVAVERFATCAAVEGESLSDSDRALLQEALAPLLARVGETDCVADSEACERALRATPCEGLADLWRPSIAAEPTREPLPPWADTLAAAQRERTLACLAAQESRPVAPDERETVDAFVRTLWGSLASKPCNATAAEAQRCAAIIFGGDCDAVAEELEPGALQGGMASEACEPIVDCLPAADPRIDEASQAQ